MSTQRVPKELTTCLLWGMPDRPIDRALEWAKARGWDQSEFAERLGVDRANVTNWKNRRLPPERFKQVADLFGRTVDELIGEAPAAAGQHAGPPEARAGLVLSLENAERADAGRPIPVISWVQAGELSGVEDPHPPGEADEWVQAVHSRPGPRAFALRVVGDSMTNPVDGPSFPEGTILIVDPEVAPDPGRFVIAKDIDTHKASFKRLMSDGLRWYLRPLNPAYPTREIDDPALRVIGVVVEFSLGGKV